MAVSLALCRVRARPGGKKPGRIFTDTGSLNTVGLNAGGLNTVLRPTVVVGAAQPEGQGQEGADTARKQARAGPVQEDETEG